MYQSKQRKRQNFNKYGTANYSVETKTSSIAADLLQLRLLYLQLSALGSSLCSAVASVGKTRAFWLAATSLMVALTAGTIRAQEGSIAQVYHLRVYGVITAVRVHPQSPDGLTYQHLKLTANNHAKAQIVVSKMLRDFTTLPTVKAVMITADGTTIPALYFNGGRRIVPVLRANKNVIDVYGFATPADLAAFLKATPQRLIGAENLLTRHYPFFMDFWDRHCLGSWYHILLKYSSSDDDRYAFLKHNGMSVNTANAFVTAGVRAGRYGIGYLINRWFEQSNLILNACPEALSCADPDMTYEYNYYGNVPFAVNPIQDFQNREMINFINHLPAKNHLETIGDPYGETGPHDWDYLGLTGRDRYSLLDFVHYLRDIRGFSLQRLGIRWYGNANRFKNWNAVTFPRERDFYGWKTGQSQELSGIWRTLPIDRSAGISQGVYKVHYVDRKWLTFRQPGTEYLTGGLSMAPRPAGGWMRFIFTPSAVLLHSGKPIYLTVCPFNLARYVDPDTVYLNGNKLGDISFGYGMEWKQSDVTKKLHQGANLLAIYTPAGCVRGPVFLTQLKAAMSFPMPNAHLDARLYDLREWTASDCARGNARAMKYIRRVDPYRPIKVYSFDSMTDVMMPYLQKLGGYPHCTGEGAFFRPWYKRFAYIRGIPDSSEPGGPANTVMGLKKLFFIMTFEGMNAHDYFWDIQNILDHPDQKAWFVKKLPYLKLMGRFDLRKPNIAIANSFRVNRVKLDAAEPGLINDPGRGDIQESHYDWVYCSEQDIRAGLVNHYKIILDDDFCTLHPYDVTALKKWVRRGGTLVLNQNSGRNTYRKADAWPIDILTGCKATIRPQTGTLTFVAHPAILQSYAGRTFTNKGWAIDWQKHDYFKDSISLTPQAKGIDIIARYQDGKPAIVMRLLGKGRVVVLGSAFYRHSYDAMKGYFVGNRQQTAFYKALFSSLGARPLVHSANERLWAERFISNSGSTEMLLLGNSSHTRPLKNASAIWDLSFAPKRVFDPTTGKMLPVEIHGRTVSISHLNLSPNETRYYAVEMTDWSALGAVNHWLFRQNQLWHSVPKGKKLPKMNQPMPLMEILGKFQVKQFNTEQSARRAVAVDYKPGAGWQSLSRADWASAGLRTGVNIWAVYRKTFNVNNGWLAGLGGVEPIWGPMPMGGVPDKIAINGLTIIKNDQPVVSPQALLAVLQPGKNLFTFICHGRRPDGDGGFTGYLALGQIPAGKVVDESHNWTLYRTITSRYQVSFPANGKWVMARKSIVIPDHYHGYNVWIQVKSIDPNYATLVSTNGIIRYPTDIYGGQRFTSHPLLINITPDVHFGKPNDIIIGGQNLNSLQPQQGSFNYVHLIFSKVH